MKTAWVISQVSFPYKRTVFGVTLLAWFCILIFFCAPRQSRGIDATGHRLMVVVFTPRRLFLAVGERTGLQLWWSASASSSVYQEFGYDFPFAWFLVRRPGPDILGETAREWGDLTKPPFGFRSNVFSPAGLGSSIHSPLHALTCPLWPLVVATLYFVAIPMVRWGRARRRAASGRCLTCGFDLRASPVRCPECGTPARPSLADARRRGLLVRRWFGLAGLGVSVCLWGVAVAAGVVGPDPGRVLCFWTGQRSELIVSLTGSSVRAIVVRRFGTEQSGAFFYNRVTGIFEEMLSSSRPDYAVDIDRPLGSALWPNFGFWLSSRTELNNPVRLPLPAKPIARSVRLQVPIWSVAVVSVALLFWPRHLALRGKLRRSSL